MPKITDIRELNQREFKRLHGEFRRILLPIAHKQCVEAFGGVYISSLVHYRVNAFITNTKSIDERTRQLYLQLSNCIDHRGSK